MRVRECNKTLNVTILLYFCLSHKNVKWVVLFGSARTEWGHLANPQLTWHSFRQEPVVLPVVLRAVALHTLNASAGMKQYECDRTQTLL